jgi:hypothetical protein
MKTARWPLNKKVDWPYQRIRIGLAMLTRLLRP